MDRRIEQLAEATKQPSGMLYQAKHYVSPEDGWLDMDTLTQEAVGNSWFYVLSKNGLIHNYTWEQFQRTVEQYESEEWFSKALFWRKEYKIVRRYSCQIAKYGEWWEVELYDRSTEHITVLATLVRTEAQARDMQESYCNQNGHWDKCSGYFTRSK